MHNIVARIEARIQENKSSIKTYASHQFAEVQGDKISKAALDYYDCENGRPMDYIIVFLPHVKRWTVVFCLSSFIRSNKTGGYIGWISEKGFFSI